MIKTSVAVKSKERVQKHGEVFTPKWVVNDMLNMLPDEVWKPETRFLEPACGEGAFLIEIYKRKLQNIAANSKEEWEWQTAIATSSIYGIELLEDNTQQCRENLHHLFHDFVQKNYPNTQDKEFTETIRFLIQRNIIRGNALTYRKCNVACGNTCNTCKEIVFSEWTAVSITNDELQNTNNRFPNTVGANCYSPFHIIRKDFTYEGIINADKMRNSAAGGLFEEEFSKEEHGLIKEYNPVHFKKLRYAEN